jgi:hypothetical protein
MFCTFYFTQPYKYNSDPGYIGAYFPSLLAELDETPYLAAYREFDEELILRIVGKGDLTQLRN